MKNQGDYLDIHCGGVDNIFPHHTNEIAQSEAYLGHAWCKHWFHVHHLNDETGKMSKSKGEFLTVSLLVKKGYDPLAYRYFCLESHYRKPLTFSYEGLDNATKAYNKLINRIAAIIPEGDVDEAVVEKYRADMIRTVGNDLNTAMGITLLYNILKEKVSGNTKRAVIALVDSVFALSLLDKADARRKEAEDAAKAKAEAQAAEANSHAGDPEADMVEAAIAERLAAKKAKDFARADAIRAELLAKGIILTDIPGGTKWERK